MAGALEILQSLVSSDETPGDFRRVIRDSVVALRDPGRNTGERAADAISILGELAEDPRIPSHARVGLWKALSKLEPIRE